MRGGALVNPVYSAGDRGRAVGWTDTASTATGLTYLAQQALPSSAELTLLILAAPVSAAVGAYAFSQTGAGGFVPQYSVGFNAGPSLANESGSVNLYSRDQAASSFKLPASFASDAPELKLREY